MSEVSIKREEETLGLVVPKSLYGAIVSEAGRRGTSISGTIRQLLQESLGLPVESGGRRSRIAAQLAAQEASHAESA